MRYLSLFSGIEAASAAWHPLGWTCVGVAEIEPFPCAVLKHHYGDVPNLGDVSKVTADDIKRLGHIDLIVGGFPCQDLSVAGKRKGLKNADGSITRSGLFFEAMRLVRSAREHCGLRWLLIENVPGIYSNNRGHDFAALVGEVVGCGFGVPGGGWGNTGVACGPDGQIEWTTLDAQWFGLAQRRKRMFALGDFGDWAHRPPVLFEPASLRGNPPPRRETGERVAPTVARGSPCGGRTYGLDADTCDSLIAFDTTQIMSKANRSNPQPGDPCHPLTALGDAPSIAHCLNAHPNRSDGESETFVVMPLKDPSSKGDAGALRNSIHGEPGDPMFTMTANSPHGVFIDGVAHSLRADGFDASEGGTGRGTPLVPVAFGWQNSSSQGLSDSTDIVPTLDKSKTPAVTTLAAVRRLTPRECARLQGFPDSYLDITYRGKPAADGPKYRALGNSMAVPVMRWIGRRILAADAAK